MSRERERERELYIIVLFITFILLIISRLDIEYDVYNVYMLYVYNTCIHNTYNS